MGNYYEKLKEMATGTLEERVAKYYGLDIKKFLKDLEKEFPQPAYGLDGRYSDRFIPPVVQYRFNENEEIPVVIHPIKALIGVGVWKREEGEEIVYLFLPERTYRLHENATEEEKAKLRKILGKYGNWETKFVHKL